MNMEVNANYATWEDLGIVPPTLLTDTVYFVDTGVLSEYAAMVVDECAAIRDANNTAKPKYRPLREVVYPETGRDICSTTGNVRAVWHGSGTRCRIQWSSPMLPQDHRVSCSTRSADDLSSRF